MYMCYIYGVSEVWCLSTEFIFMDKQILEAWPNLNWKN